MRRSEIYDDLMDHVCEICEVRRELVVGDRKLQAVFDARLLAVQYLRRLGMSNDDIALLVLREQAGDPTYMPLITDIRKKARSVARMFSSYSERCRHSVDVVVDALSRDACGAMTAPRSASLLCLVPSVSVDYIAKARAE